VDRKPGQLLEFFGVEAGMTALDLMAGPGYLTEMLSAGVGMQGRVYAQNDVMSLRMRNGAIQKAMDRRLLGKRLPNTRAWTNDITDLGLHEQIDIAILSLNLHDLYNFGGEQQVVAAFASIMTALRPGGIFGIVDHVGMSGRDNVNLHRIDPRIAEQLLVKAGFMIVDRSALLANPLDDHTLHVFDPAVRGRTDQFIIKAMKPRY
jgi:predicted methyltransferase